MSLEHEALSNKTALVEVSFGTRYHFRGIGRLRLKGEERALELAMECGCKVSGKEVSVFPVTAEQAIHFLPSAKLGYDLVFEGVFRPTGLRNEPND